MSSPCSFSLVLKHAMEVSGGRVMWEGATALIRLMGHMLVFKVSQFSFDMLNANQLSP